MFTNMLMTSFTAPITPLCRTSETSKSCWDNRPFTAICPEPSRHKPKDTEITKKIKKKPKRVRTSFTTEQIRALENMFSHTKYINTDNRRTLAERLSVGEKSIKIWFQNRRMKEKRDSESSCESSNESISIASPSPHLQMQPFTLEIGSEIYQTEVPISMNNDSELQYTNYNIYPNYSCNNYCTVQYPHSYYSSTNEQFTYDSNVYPTQYYPLDSTIDYSKTESQNVQYANSWTNCCPDSSCYHFN